MDPSAIEVHRDLGKHEAEIAQLRTDMAAMRLDVHAMRSDLSTIREKLSEREGERKTAFAIIATLAAVFGSVLTKIVGKYWS